MSEPTETDRELQVLGLALRKLREDLNISQKAAGAAHRPAPLGSQAWGLYENGKIKGLLEPTVQDQLTAAIGQTRDALLLERERIAMFGPPPLRRKITDPANGTLGVREAPRSFLPAGVRQAVFPLGAGEVSIQFPANMDDDDKAQFQTVLAMLAASVSKKPGA